MPNSFRFGFEPERLQKCFGLSDAPRFAPDSDECKPGALVATIEWNAHGKPICQLARFGFRMRDGVVPMTTFRCESIKVSEPQRIFTDGRCIVPADVVYQQVASGQGPVAVGYVGKNQRMLGLAGMLRPEAIGLSVTLLTVPATAAVRSLNGRMPVVLCEEDYALWMDDTTSVIDALGLTRHARDDLLAEDDPAAPPQQRVSGSHG